MALQKFNHNEKTQKNKGQNLHSSAKDTNFATLF